MSATHTWFGAVVVNWRCTRSGAGRVFWASGYRERCWAVESARGLGYLLSQQLVAAGERVLDVPPMMASRVRVLGSGRSQKNDPNDARSIAIAGACLMDCVRGWVST